MIIARLLPEEDKSIFKFESKRLRKVPYIDLNRFSNIDYCVDKLAINQDGDFGLLGCNNIVYLFSKNGAYKGSFSSEINKPIFLVPIREHWFVFNNKGDGESVFDKSSKSFLIFFSFSGKKP